MVKKKETNLCRKIFNNENIEFQFLRNRCTQLEGLRNNFESKAQVYEKENINLKAETLELRRSEKLASKKFSKLKKTLF